MTLGYNMQGQEVDLEKDNASGYYLYSDEAIANGEAPNNCAPGMRPGMMVIRGLEQPIPTCGGKVYQENLPDVHVIDWRYKMYVQLVLAALVAIMLVAIIAKLTRK